MIASEGKATTNRKTASTTGPTVNGALMAAAHRRKHHPGAHIQDPTPKTSATQRNPVTLELQRGLRPTRFLALARRTTYFRSQENIASVQPRLLQVKRLGPPFPMFFSYWASARMCKTFIIDLCFCCQLKQIACQRVHMIALPPADFSAVFREVGMVCSGFDSASPNAKKKKSSTCWNANACGATVVGANVSCRNTAANKSHVRVPGMCCFMFFYRWRDKLGLIQY